MKRALYVPLSPALSLSLCLPVSLVVACGSPPKKKVEEPKPVTRVPIEEPEEEEGITYTSDRGTMDIEVVKAGIAPHAEALTTCYTSQVGARKWLGGRVSMHWEITKDAEVTSVQMAESDLGAWEIEKCLLEVARQATFGKPKGNADAEFDVPLTFEKGRPAAMWDEEQSLRAIGGQVALLDECAVDEEKLRELRKEYMKQKAKRPAAKQAKKPANAAKGNGKANGSGNGDKDDDEPRLIAKPDDVTVTLYIGPGGKALSVGFASPRTVLDERWTECAAKTAMGWRLPDTKGGIAKVSAKYRPAE